MTFVFRFDRQQRGLAVELTKTVDRPDLVTVRERHTRLLQRIAERYDQLDEQLSELESRLPHQDEPHERLVKKPR